MQERHILHNERLAQYLESTWPNCFSELCSALRRYPLPITSGAAATVLRGSSMDALRAIDVYCRSLQQCQQPPGCVESEFDLLPPLSGSLELNNHMAVVFSPFRYFKLRRFEMDTSLQPAIEGVNVYNNSNNAGNDGEYYHHDDILLTLLDSTFPNCRDMCTNRPASSSPPPPVTHRIADDNLVEEKLNVRELRAKCASRGLLTSGTKLVLLARLRQYDNLQQSETPSQLIHVGTRKEISKNSEIGLISPRRFTLTQEEQIEHSQRLRTPFLSTSPSTSRQLSPFLENSPRHRWLVGTPQEFIAALTEQKKRGNDVNKSSKTLAMEEKTAQCQWRILVDNRERVHGAHSRMIEALAATGINTMSCTLPCGDFMIEIDMPNDMCRVIDVALEEQICNNFNAVHGTLNVGTNTSTQRVFSVVVERKTVKDLCASIATSRYYEQRQLLTLLPFHSVVWVVEGTTELLRPDEQRRVLSACASLAAMTRFRVIRTRHLKETILWLRHLGTAYVDALVQADGGNKRRPQLAVTTDCLNLTAKVRRELRARTTFPRMLMCVRGCSSALATQLACKYGSLLKLWRRLRDCGRENCDADADIRNLTAAQKDVYVRLTEFLLTEEYC